MMSLTMSSLARAEVLERIQSRGSINLGYLSEEAPFSSAESGKPEGYAIDLCEAVVKSISATTGKSVNANYMEVDDDSALAAIASGRIDLLCSASVVTLAHLKQVSFSVPIYNGGIAVLISSKAPDDLLKVLNGETVQQGPIWRATVNRGLQNRRFAVHEGTVTESWVREQVAALGVQVSIVDVKTHQEGAEMVAAGKVDGYFSGRIILENLVSTHPKYAKDLKVVGKNYDFESVALALPRNDDDFRLAVDTALSSFYSQDKFWDEYSRYFGKPTDMTKTLFEVYSLK